jgi:hypothetical protein
MLRFLYSWFHWVPILGAIIKTAYISSLVKQLVGLSNSWSPNEQMRQRTGGELDEALGDEANDLVSEFIRPLNLGLAADIVRRLAVDKIVSVMRQKIIT